MITMELPAGVRANCLEANIQHITPHYLHKEMGKGFDILLEKIPHCAFGGSGIFKQADNPARDFVGREQ